jgi:exonuclease III
MIIMSFNIRGLGGRVKRRRIRELVREHKVDFQAVQETKLESISEKLCHNLWGSIDCDWAFYPSNGASGGILSIWSKQNSKLIFTFMGEGFVGVCLEWGILKSICFVVNVYSKCDLPSKRRLWDNISMSKVGFGRGRWCVVGDFNAVLSPEDRRGVSRETYSSVEMRGFGRFLEDVELIDLLLLGRRFTWCHANRVAMSRIDRVWVSPEWLDMWGDCSVWVSSRDVSDHCPLVLKYANNEWGPKPFRFNNYWLENKSFKKIVEECWRGQVVEGWMAIVLKEKLKSLKVCLKEWNSLEYGCVDSKIKKIVEEINVLDIKSEERGLNDTEVALRKDRFEEFWKLQKMKEASLFQRSRSKWLRQGDANTKFFHGCVSSRGRRNAILALKVDDVWLEKPNLVREAVVGFFESHFAAPMVNRPTLDGVNFPGLSREENVMLTAPFSLDEIYVAVKESDGNKSPGPDGFNYAFLKNSWDLLKAEVRIMFDQFHGIGVLPKDLLSYFVTLIPKINSPFGLGDYRPISLLGCLYKLIAEVLASRLAKVMNSLIAPNQSAFIKGRNLVDGVLVVNELVDLAKKQLKDCLIFKVDFEKAYDSVDWGFLEYMLRRFGFCEKWIGWIRACVFGGNLSVLVNGCPTREINIQRGLKQGDPLAPFLFLLVVEGFGGVMRRAVDLDLFKGFKIRSGGPIISHLQYADDTLCIGDASLQNLWTLKAILRGFELASGMKVNFWKSCLIGINVENSFMEMACIFLNCIRGFLPFKYLGLPVGASARRVSTWETMVEKIRKSLNSWGNKHISFGGKLVLINSVLNSIPIFYMSYMKMPVQVRKKVVRIQRDFLWGGVNGKKKLSWVKWKVVCQDKKKGGLGVRDLELVNLSLLIKWRWRLLNGVDSALWKEVLVAKYGKFMINNVKWSCEPTPYLASTWWRDIRDLESCVDSPNWVEDAITRKMGNGMRIRFWEDVWLEDSPLCSKFPRLFALSLQKEVCVGNMMEEVDGRRRWKWNWRRSLFQWEEERVSVLEGSLANVTLSEAEDSWVWRLNPEEGFSVNSTFISLREFSEVGILSDFEEKIFSSIWDSPAPSKVVAFSWQLLHNRIPTKDNLHLREILTQAMGSRCVWCDHPLESANHLFLFCKVAHVVWYEIFRWLGLVIVMPPSIMILFDCVSESAKNKMVRKGLRFVWHTVVWSLWCERNKEIFNNVKREALEIVEEVKVLSWRWSVDRLKIAPCSYYEWIWDPGGCFSK